MLSFHTAAAVAAAPICTSLDPALRRLLGERVDDWTVTGLLGLTHLLIVPAGESQEAIVGDVGFSPLVNPIDGACFPSPNFIPHHDWLERHDGWFELIFTFQDGFAFVLFVKDSEDKESDLLAFCRTHAAAGGR